MMDDHRLKLAFLYDEWVLIARAVGDTALAEKDPHLLSLAARLERGLGHPAVARSFEAAAERALVEAPSSSFVDCRPRLDDLRSKQD